MKTIVLSLGGSLIIPDKIDTSLLEKFKKVIEKHYKNYKFIVVCGGGAIARKYIESLKREHKNEKTLALAGIRATRMNASFMMQFFGKDANIILPKDMKDVENQLKKNKIVFCGALRWTPNATSDTTAAKLAQHTKSDFVNLTKAPGLYTSDPSKYKTAKLIPEISWKDFKKKALSMKYQPGQHFILDQNASKIIDKHKIKTYILGKDMNNLDKFLSNKKFIGTTIHDI